MDAAKIPYGGRFYRTALIGFILGAVAAAVVGDFLRSAYAQIPNAGQQRQDTNNGLQQLNSNMAEVLSVLKTGTLKVRIVEADKSSAGSSRSSTGTSGSAAPRTASPSGGASGGSGRPSR